MDALKPYLKAIVGGLIAAASTASTLTDDGINSGEWLSILAAFLIGFSGVYAVPNKPRKADIGQP